MRGVDFTSAKFIFMIKEYTIWDNVRINDSMSEEDRPIPSKRIYLGSVKPTYPV